MGLLAEHFVLHPQKPFATFHSMLSRQLEWLSKPMHRYKAITWLTVRWSGRSCLGCVGQNRAEKLPFWCSFLLFSYQTFLSYSFLSPFSHPCSVLRCMLQSSQWHIANFTFNAHMISLLKSQFTVFLDRMLFSFVFLYMNPTTRKNAFARLQLLFRFSSL